MFWTSIAFGYRRVPRRDGVPAHVVVEESEASVVRQIFKWHADEGISCRMIAKRLSQPGNLPPRRGGKAWGETSVLRIVHNEAYIGTIYYNRIHTVSVVPHGEGRDKGTSKTKTIVRPKAEWISVSIPPIIDRETFERSQVRHERNRDFSPRRLKEERWLLRRLLRCGRCHQKLACTANSKNRDRLTHYYYRCGKSSDSWRHRTHCRPNHIPAPPLDEAIWQQIRHHLLHPQLLLRAHRQLSETPSLDDSFLIGQLQAAQKRLRQSQAEKRRLVDAYQGGFLPREEFEERATKLSERIAGLEADLHKLKQEQQTSIDGRRLLQRIQEFTRVATERLDQMTFVERQALARSVLDEVVMDGDQVHLYFKIPLPKPTPEPPRPGSQTKVSKGFDLRSHRGLRWRARRQCLHA